MLRQLHNLATDDTVAPFHNPVVAATIAARTAAAFAEAPYQA